MHSASVWAPFGLAFEEIENAWADFSVPADAEHLARWA